MVDIKSSGGESCRICADIKKSYVDVFNPGGAARPPAAGALLAPPPPAAPANYFVPAPQPQVCAHLAAADTIPYYNI